MSYSEGLQVKISQLELQVEALRRLLDDARAQKPVAFRYRIGGPTVEWRYAPGDATLTRSAIVESEPLYAAAPVPAQPAADVAAIAKAVRDIPSRVESLGGQRFAYVKLSEVIDTIYSVAGKQPAAVPEAVAKVVMRDDTCPHCKRY